MIISLAPCVTWVIDWTWTSNRVELGPASGRDGPRAPKSAATSGLRADWRSPTRCCLIFSALLIPFITLNGLAGPCFSAPAGRGFSGPTGRGFTSLLGFALAALLAGVLIQVTDYFGWVSYGDGAGWDVLNHY